MQVKQITSEMQQFLPTASGAAGLQRNSGWLCNAKGFFFLRYICKIPGSACGSCMQPPGEEHTPEEFLPTFHRCYLNVRAESFLQFVYSKQQIKPHKCARRRTPELLAQISALELHCLGGVSCWYPQAAPHWVPPVPIPALGPELWRSWSLKDTLREGNSANTAAVSTLHRPITSGLSVPPQG